MIIKKNLKSTDLIKEKGCIDKDIAIVLFYNYYYDYIKDLKTCNDDFIKGGSNNSSFDDYSYEENSPQIEIKRKLIDEKKEINVNLFNKNFQK